MNDTRLDNSGGYPTQATLSAVLSRTTRMTLEPVRSTNKAVNKKVVLDIIDPVRIDEFRNLLAISEDPKTFGHCMCDGSEAISLYEGKQVLARISLHHGRSIRWSAWKWDAILLNGRGLVQWLAYRGYNGALQEVLDDERRAEENRAASVRWHDAMPSALGPLWRTVFSRNADIDAIDAVLQSSYPDVKVRTLKLLHWFGCGQGPWSGYPSYEGVAETLLLRIPFHTLAKILTEESLTNEQIEGTARLIASWQFGKAHGPASLPSELRRLMLNYAAATEVKDKRERLQSGLKRLKLGYATAQLNAKPRKLQA